MVSRTQSIAAAAVVLALTLAGCGSDSAPEATESTQPSAEATNPAAGPAAPQEGAPGTSAAPAAPQPGRRAYTIVEFIRDNEIQEVQLHPGQPGAPVVNLPMPPGWVDAGSVTPEWAWRAIYLADPALSVDPPNIVTLVSKLTGPGAARVLAYAPGELRNMAEFDGGEGAVKKLSGFNAYVMSGTFVRADGVRRAIVQTTMVAPTPDGAFIMQSNGDGLPEQLDLLRDTMKQIDDQTTFTP